VIRGAVERRFCACTLLDGASRTSS